MSLERMNVLVSQLGEPDPDIKKTEIHYLTADGQRQRSGTPLTGQDLAIQALCQREKMLD